MLIILHVSFVFLKARLLTSKLPAYPQHIPAHLRKKIKGKPQLELTLTTVHNSLDRTVDNQKAVEAKAIAAAHTTSSEQSGSIGEKNQNSTPVHSDSTTSKASSVPFISLSKMSTLTSK